MARGENYYFLPKPVPGRNYSERFNPNRIIFNPGLAYTRLRIQTGQRMRYRTTHSMQKQYLTLPLLSKRHGLGLWDCQRLLLNWISPRMFIFRKYK